MTDTLSARERELVEAARSIQAHGNGWFSPYLDALQAALRAYDPPRKVYTMPPWEEFLLAWASNVDFSGEPYAIIEPYDGPGKGSVSKSHYNLIREALAKDEP